MLYKSLLISIIIHLLILSWAGSSLPFCANRTKTGSSPDQQLEYRTITLIELPPPSAGAWEDRSVRMQASLTANSPEKTAQQSASLDYLSPQSDGAHLSSLVQAPAELRPLLTRSEPKPVEKATVSSQPTQLDGYWADLSSQDRSIDSPLSVEVETELEAGQEEKLTPSSAPICTNDATATGENAPLTDSENDPSNDFAHTPVYGSGGDSSRDDKSTLPTGFESDSAPNLVKVFYVDPVYPRFARRRGWEGTVYLDAQIAPDGKVMATEITQSSGYELLDRAALEAVSRWQYAWLAGQPTADETTITVKIRFQLEE